MVHWVKYDLGSNEVIRPGLIGSYCIGPCGMATHFISFFRQEHMPFRQNKIYSDKIWNYIRYSDSMGTASDENTDIPTNSDKLKTF